MKLWKAFKRNVDATHPANNAHKLEFVTQLAPPYKSKDPLRFSNKPELLDPTITIDQLVMLHNGGCIYQGDIPRITDFINWQAAIKGLRFCRALPGHQSGVVEVGLFRRGDVIYHTPAPLVDEYNHWERILNEIRLVANAPTI